MKKIIISLAVLAVSATAIVVTNVNNRLDKHFETNIDALAASEGGVSGIARCFSNIPYGTYSRYLQCKTCVYVDGQEASSWGLCW